MGAVARWNWANSVVTFGVWVTEFAEPNVAFVAEVFEVQSVFFQIWKEVYRSVRTN